MPEPKFTRFTCPGCQKRFRIPQGKAAPRLCPACNRVESQISGATPPDLDDLLAAVEAETQPPLPTMLRPAPPPLPMVFKPAELSSADKRASIAEAAEGYILATTVVPGPRPYGEIAKVNAKCGIFIGLLLLLALRQAPSFLIVIPYFGILLIVASSVVLLSTRFPAVRSKTGKLVAFFAAGLMIWILAGFDQYDESREKDGVKAVTTFSRWGRTPLKRSITVKEGDGFYWTSGPLSASGKPHGEWKNLGIGVGAFKSREWYWYGEEITEGEWHLRNK
jgi:hypothetical protein